MLTVWLIQLVLLIYIAKETFDKIELEFPQSIPSPQISIIRFLACLIMHLSLQKKLNDCLSRTKFALNHYWRFESVPLAFLSSFF